MYQLNEFLSQLGLTGKEIKAYLTLLELGSQPASIIAKKIEAPRSSTLVHLESLTEKGFAKKDATIRNTGYFSAIKPAHIKNLLTHKKKKLDENLNTLDQLIPQFNNIAKSFLPHSKVSYFEGVEGLCKMIDFLLEEDVPVYFISGHTFHPEIRKYIRDVWITKRKTMKTKCQMILAKFDDSEDYIKTSKGVYEWIGFMVTRGGYNFDITIAVYGDKVQFLSCKEDDLTGIVIENAHIATTLLSVFMVLKHTNRVDTVVGNN